MLEEQKRRSRGGKSSRPEVEEKTIEEEETLEEVDYNSKSIKGRLVVSKNKPMSKEEDSRVGDLTQGVDLETKEEDQIHSQVSVFNVAKLVTLLGDA